MPERRSLSWIEERLLEVDDTVMVIQASPILSISLKIHGS